MWTEGQVSAVAAAVCDLPDQAVKSPWYCSAPGGKPQLQQLGPFIFFLIAKI